MKIYLGYRNNIYFVKRGELQMKIYLGKRVKPSNIVLVKELESKEDFKPLFHLIYHSPDGFEWGYGGSGPADLALSILFDYFKQDKLRAFGYHQIFKQEFIVPLKDDHWVISEKEIDAFFNTIKTIEPTKH